MPSDQANPKPDSSASVPDPILTPEEADKTLEDNKRRSASGLSWDETEPKAGDKFNRVTEMGEAD